MSAAAGLRRARPTVIVMTWRRVGSVVAVLVLVLGPNVARSVSASGTCLSAPVSGPITARFVAPACPYCSGRRTLGFRAAIGEVVRSPLAGRVHFTGDVVGRGFVTVASSVYLVTVGGLEPGPGLGTSVARGQELGLATGPVQLSLRRTDGAGLRSYLDPEPFLVRWRVPARLLPLDGSPARPVRAVLGCRTTIGGGASGLGPR